MPIALASGFRSKIDIREIGVMGVTGPARALFMETEFLIISVGYVAGWIVGGEWDSHVSMGPNRPTSLDDVAMPR